MKNNLLWLLTFLIGICWQNVSRAQCAGFSAAATTVSNYNGQAVTCFGAADGAANVVATGGTVPYSYLWSIGGQTGSMATGLAAGVYTVMATDAIGCTVTAAVTITQPTQITVNNVTQNNVFCFGGAEGAACAVATGGTGVHSFMWSNGQSTSCATGLTAGSYTVTVMDANGCIGVGTATITQPATAVQASIGTQTNATCADANGSACAVAMGGTGLLSFMWSNGQTTSCASGLFQGSYTVTVMDANACTSVATTTITNASVSPISVAANTVSNYNGQAVSCFGAADGAANVVATGGTAPYSYFWSLGGQTGSVVTGLSAGVYPVMATDAIGCTVTAAVTITQPTQIIVNNLTQVDVLCFGGADGVACATASGGTGAHTFLWSNGIWANGQTTSCATGLSAGSYMVTVIDANNCTSVAATTITQPAAAIQAGIGSQTNSTCLNANGTACATASGGVAPYMVLWSNGQTTSCASGLMAGSYTVTIIDANNCTSVATTTITNTSVSSVSVNISSQVNVFCAGGGNGSACAAATGGTAPYTFLWSNGRNTSCATGLPAGNHTVTVTDANGCAGVAMVTITQPATAVQANIGTQTNATCATANGSACAVATGGSAPYTFLWSDLQITSCATGLMAGNYFVTVTDINGCVRVAAATITNTSSLSVSISSQVNVFCAGGANGSACATTAGGVAPYSFVWSNGQTSSCATGLAAGGYTVTVADANGCVRVSTVTITQPTQIIINNFNQSNVSCFGGADGSACPSVLGGVGGYTFLWSNLRTTFCTSGLAAGSYTLTVTDMNGCIGVSTATISQPAAIQVGIGSQTNETCANANGTACVTIFGGNPPYTWAWANGAITSCASGLSAGNQFVTVTDASGCVGVATATITSTSVSSVSVSIASQVNVLCANTASGSACAVATGGTAPYTFQWTNGQTTSCASGLSAGNHTVTVIDGNGCAGVATITISQPATAMQVGIGSQTNATCLNANGSACAVVTGGVGIVSYVWSNNGQTTSCASGLSAGNHFVTATDANGCIDVATVAITNTSSISVGISSQVNVSCFGQTNGSLCVSVLGGVAPYNFIWSNGQTSSCATGLAAGNYTVTVTDANNCPVIRNMTLTQPAQALQVAINQSCQLQNGSFSATAVATGGTVFYNYVWNNGQTTGQVTGLLLGNVVTVSVTDANGCQAQHTITVSNNSSNITYTPQVSHSNCGINARLGRINLSVTAVNPTFRWSSGQQTQNIFGLQAGVYTVTISAQGCQEIATFSVGGIAVLPQFTHISCNNPGTIQLIGNLPYQYRWSNGSTNATLSSQNSQNYQVTITDPLSGCSVIQNYYLNTSCYSTVQGQINYVDANGNCTGTNAYSPNVWLRELHTNNVYMAIASQGFYRFNIFNTNQADSFEVFLDTTRPAVQMICPTPHLQTIYVPLGQTATVPSFYVDVNGNDLQVLPFSGGFIPGFMRSMCVPVRNDGEAVNSAFLVLQYPPTIQFANTSAPYQHDAINHRITFTLPSMAHNQTIYACINFITPIGTPLGTPIPITATVYPISGDLTPSNNTCQNVFTVSGSYDPNDKQVQPFHSNNEFAGGIILPEEEVLHYTIRFQNTGTAPAQFVIIRDTLDAHLLPETIHNIETSHNADVRLAGRELVFEMDNIMLPDSATDLEGSQGFVKFSINRDNTLPLGTNIANTAAIYFDYNLPVITNTTNSVVDILSALEQTPMTQHQWKVMPNPFDENLTIQYTLHQSSATQIYLVNALGQTVQMLPQQAEQTAGEYQTQISTQNLPSGIYWIVLETTQGKLAQKIVKQGSR